jgi:HEAT repeat protein
VSLALLHQLYDETRRLTVAGSATAPGDFRLKKLVEPLNQVGAKAPVFEKLAEQANHLIESNEQTAPEALLELLGLATAIRYTQGETGLPGTIEPLGATIPLARSTEVSARTMQPLLEALGRTGAGRHEVIHDAYLKGLFKDVRLVKRAVAALDDSYSEIAELFARTIIPESYGPGIAPLIRKGYDPKGKQGSARRLRLLHTFDPAGTRELVMQALENGSKEVRAAAVACLGLHSDDVHILIEQLNAKAQDVRTAAYYALSQLDSEEAVNALAKVMADKELVHAWRPISQCNGPRLRKAIIAQFRLELAELFTLRDKKEISARIERLGYFLNAIRERTDQDSEAMVLELFAQRDKLSKVKGDTLSGSDLNLDVVRAMAAGSKGYAERLTREHGTLEAEALGPAFQAALMHLSPQIVFDEFSAYLISPVGTKKAEQSAKSNTIIQYLTWSFHGGLRLDPRWLDVAIHIENLGLIRGMGTIDHPGMVAYLKSKAEQMYAYNPRAEQFRVLVETMVQLKHPEAASYFLKAINTIKPKTDYASLWSLGNSIVHLPKSVLPELESFMAKLEEAHANHWLARIEELRSKPDTP